MSVQAPLSHTHTSPHIPTPLQPQPTIPNPLVCLLEPNLRMAIETGAMRWRDGGFVWGQVVKAGGERGGTPGFMGIWMLEGGPVVGEGWMSHRRFPLYHSQVSFRRSIAIYTPTPIFPLPSPLVPYIPPGLPPISSSPPQPCRSRLSLLTSSIFTHHSPFLTPPQSIPSLPPIHSIPFHHLALLTPPPRSHTPTNQPIALPHTNIPHHPTLGTYLDTLPRPARFVKRTHR